MPHRAVSARQTTVWAYTSKQDSSAVCAAPRRLALQASSGGLSRVVDRLLVFGGSPPVMIDQIVKLQRPFGRLVSEPPASLSCKTARSWSVNAVMGRELNQHVTELVAVAASPLDQPLLLE